MNRQCFTKALESIRTDARRDGSTTKIASRETALEWLRRAGFSLGEGARDLRTDSESMAAAARLLEHVYSEFYEVDYPELPASTGELMPIDTSVPDGAKTWTYYLYEADAVARISGQFSTGLPRATLRGAEVTRQTITFENEFAYTTADLRHAAMANIPLDSMLGAAAKRAHDQAFHRVALWGAWGKQLYGLLNHPNITYVQAAATGTGGSTAFDTKDPDEVIADFTSLITSAAGISKGARFVTRVLMSRRVYEYIATTRLGVGDGSATILSHLQTVWSGRDNKLNSGTAIEFAILEELNYVTAQEEAAAWTDGGQAVDVTEDTGDIMLAYCHTQPSRLAVVRPMQPTLHPIQAHGLEFITPVESGHGGVKMVEPPMVARMEGVWLPAA